SRKIAEPEKPVDHFRAHTCFHRRIGENRLYFRSEYDCLRRQPVIQRFDADPVSGEKKLPLTLIPDREAKHTTQSLNTGLAEFLVQMNDYLRIRFGPERMALRDQVVAKLLIVIDLTVKNDPDGAIFI